MAYYNGAKITFGAQLNALQKSYVHDNFANALKGYKSGGAVGADDVSPIEHAVKVAVRTKNLIPYQYTNGTYTENGITFTDNGDGTITVNGTATANTINYFHFDASNPVILQRGIYTLSGAPSGSSYETYRIGIRYYKDGVKMETGVYDAPTSIEMDAFDVVYIVVCEGQTVENLVFKPQLESGTTATDFTKYVGDLSAVNVNQYGKNLCTPQQVYKGANRYSETVKDGRNCVACSDGTSFKNYGFPFEPNTQYTLSIDFAIINDNGYEGVSTYSNVISIYYTDGTRTPISDRGGCGWVHKVITTEIGKTIESIGMQVADYRTLVYIDVDTFQFERGTVGTEYEPYTVETTTANANGTIDGITSISPNMTLATDNNGVVLDMEYNRDINKAFDDITKAIISLGGNV